MKEFDLSTIEKGKLIHIPFIFELGKHKLMLNALWDTGSAGCCINESLIPKGTSSIGQERIKGINDDTDNECQLYKANVYYFDDCVFKNVTISSAKMTEDAIIGMNIIGQLKSTIEKGVLAILIAG